MKDNCKRKIAQLNIPQQQSNQFLADIFRQIHGTEKQKGLVDGMSGEEFDCKVEKLEDLWSKRQVNGVEFFSYFAKEKAPLLKTHMTAEIWSMVGPGYPPTAYNQNANEAINSAFKRGMGRKMSLP